MSRCLYYRKESRWRVFLENRWWDFAEWMPWYIRRDERWTTYELGPFCVYHFKRAATPTEEAR